MLQGKTFSKVPQFPDQKTLSFLASSLFFTRKTKKKKVLRYLKVHPTRPELGNVCFLPMTRSESLELLQNDLIAFDDIAACMPRPAVGGVDEALQ